MYDVLDGALNNPRIERLNNKHTYIVEPMACFTLTIEKKLYNEHETYIVICIVEY